jgi:hypothetical protein
MIGWTPVTFDQIRQQVLKKPWRRLQFVLESGDRVVVDHIENIYWTATGARLRLIHDGDEWVTTPEKVTALRRAPKRPS